jgi:rhodanese-related sulfurtransferase
MEALESSSWSGTGDLRNAGHVASDGLRIPGAVHMDPTELERRHDEIPRDREITLYCS